MQIFVPVYDASAQKLEGDAVFNVDGGEIGSLHFSLNSGETKIANFSWSATAGTHTISAELRNAKDPDSGNAVALTKSETGSISVDVRANPPPPPAVAAAEQAANAVEGAISASLPSVAAAANAVFAQAETIRSDAASALESALAASAPSPAGTGGGAVLGAETYKNPASALAAVVASPGSFSFMRALEAGLLLLVGYSWIFYPLSFAAILVILYLLAKRLAGRPARG